MSRARSLLVPLLAAPLLFGCEQKPAAPAKPATAMAHAEPSVPAAPPPNNTGAPAPTGPGPLPSDHPKLGDGAQHAAAPVEGAAAAPGDVPDSKSLFAQVEAMKGELNERPKTVEILVALGGLYYDNDRYLDAIDWYRQAVELGAPLTAGWERIRKESGEVKPSALAASGCGRETIKDSEPMLAHALELLAAGKKGDALACGREAVRPVLLAHGRRANAFYLVGNPAMAIAEHEAALAIDPRFAESLFFRGAILFDAYGDDVPRLKKAKASWEAFLGVDPENPRARAVKEMLPQLDQAIALGGASKLPKPAQPEGHGEQVAMGEGGNPHGGPSAPPLDPGAAQAVQEMEITPEVVEGMKPVMEAALTALAKGDAATAGTEMKRVFPFVMAQPGKFPPPFRAKAQALMALYMATKRAPMAGPLLDQAVAAEPAVVDGLADALAAQGGIESARTLWQALVAKSADYAGRNGTAAKLK